MKSSKYKANLFFILWGGMFGGIPLVVMIAQLTNPNTREEMLVSIPFLMIFVVIGMSAFGFGIFNLIKLLKINLTEKYGTVDTATYIETLEIPMKKSGSTYDYTIKFKFKNKNGKEIIQKSIEEFSLLQIDNIKKQKLFKIKRLHNFAIMMPVDWENENKMELDTTCEYCDSIYNGIKCPYCGAPAKKKK